MGPGLKSGRVGRVSRVGCVSGPSGVGRTVWVSSDRLRLSVGSHPLKGQGGPSGA